MTLSAARSREVYNAMSTDPRFISALTSGEYSGQMNTATSARAVNLMRSLAQNTGMPLKEVANVFQSSIGILAIAEDTTGSSMSLKEIGDRNQDLQSRLFGGTGTTGFKSAKELKAEREILIASKSGDKGRMAAALRQLADIRGEGATGQALLGRLQGKRSWGDLGTMVVDPLNLLGNNTGKIDVDRALTDINSLLPGVEAAGRRGFYSAANNTAALMLSEAGGEESVIRRLRSNDTNIRELLTNDKYSAEAAVVTTRQNFAEAQALLKDAGATKFTDAASVEAFMQKKFNRNGLLNTDELTAIRNALGVTDENMGAAVVQQLLKNKALDERAGGGVDKTNEQRLINAVEHLEAIAKALQG